MKSLRDVRSVLRALETSGSEEFRGRHQWSNKDLDPTPVSERKWTKWDYMALWWGSSFNANAWAAASSLVAVGLSFSQAMAVNIIGASISSVATVANARQGAIYHIGYPITIRSQMGVWGGYFFVFLRAIVAIVWYGIQAYYTGLLFSVALRCIFGHRWTDIKPFPTSADITSYDFTAFIIIYLLQLPLMFVHPSNIRRAFEIKAFILPPTAMGLTVWACVKAGGFSKFDLATKTTVSGAALGWAWMSGINTVISAVSPMMINQPDLARYSRRPEEAGSWQGYAMFICKNLISFMSIATTSALKVLYGGDPAWNLWDQLDMILNHNWTPLARFAVFLVAMSFAFATILTNISANSIPFGADISGVAPRWLTIRRGQVLCWVLGLAIVPWKFLVDAAKFITFLGSYTILMGAVIGVVLCDFYVVRKGNIHVPSCYDGSKDGLYYFTRGVNWRGCFAWLCGFIMPFPGLIGSYDVSAVNAAAVDMYQLGWLLSVAISFSVHLVLNLLFPVPVYPKKYQHMPVTWEYLGDQTRNGLFDDEHWAGPGEPVLSVVEAGSGSSTHTHTEEKECPSEKACSGKACSEKDSVHRLQTDSDMPVQALDFR
ncbi:hypothetical protein NEOLEDRAFT_324323 [Neolentinus lepideus HHB14362 ss-1]|uniref:Allantoin permease n=1 Tax=Neolentinus lepideus HHB14362 ss-1 TaxID=1314782 RepID=A0A165VWM4_9AGAM|nr:hypothetical protein NEOLEDRAFT_324323 [Neolentinus lepideus HHB14362 ss-1]